MFIWAWTHTRTATATVNPAGSWYSKEAEVPRTEFAPKLSVPRKADAIPMTSHAHHSLATDANPAAPRTMFGLKPLNISVVNPPQAVRGAKQTQYIAEKRNMTLNEIAVEMGAPMNPRRNFSGPQTRSQFRKILIGDAISREMVGTIMRPWHCSQRRVISKPAYPGIPKTRTARNDVSHCLNIRGSRVLTLQVSTR